MWENWQQNHKKYRAQMIERNLLPGEVYTEGHFIQGEERSAFDFIDYEDIPLLNTNLIHPIHSSLNEVKNMFNFVYSSFSKIIIHRIKSFLYRKL